MIVPIKKLGEIEKLIQPILQKYEKLSLFSSPVYIQLKGYLKDSGWISGVQAVLDQVENARSIFSIVSEINAQKNDQKVLEMFSEFDAAGWLIKGVIDGKYDRIVYINRSNHNKSPDFVAYRGVSIFPIEVKMLSPQDTAEDKFISKVIAKVNNEAIPQFKEFAQQNQVTSGIILIWTHHPIKLERITYSDLDKAIKQYVIRPGFLFGIFVTIYMHGIWDFYL